MSGAQYGLAKARIYLAGFDVFRVDAFDYGRALQRMCADAGFEGHYPLDALAPEDLSPQEKAAWIYRSNLAAIGRADIVMANVADFRGAGEPDSGTAFEIGFAAALGKPIWAYREDLAALRERVPCSATQLGNICERGYLVEDFGLPLNLMLACAAKIVQGGPAECLRAISAAYDTYEGGRRAPSSCRLSGGSEIRQP
ncbi:nucleoside deoxyribosyltransferase [Paraburkholderia sp. BL27I4N3]|uniref:nucleoside 2-deoxyribosyltransferase n=1 Tax=Paraburkholderia sp. BL27I4N3 TaxID=1938805 RepID=UPI000E2733FF|nr:nucleoside 2-deoxyribosyltransferase [Paraburkholderia sp. BL27I4N3]REE07238.1 nucleoside deoxyribosyltransferase [Paraburkholderia sp. BL27I4N3]